MPSGNPLFATKSVDQLRSDAEGSHGLKRTLTATDLVLLGIGAIIGTGIFVITGHAAAANAGPAVVLSFVVAGIASAFAGLCYAEMASMIPIAGSAYTYSYATMGELVAWTIGWDLILEYAMGAATVSVGWSGYVVAFVRDFIHIDLPAAWTTAPFAYDEVASKFVTHRRDPQRARRLHHHARDHDPGRRHQGVGALQRGDRVREGHRRAAVHHDRRALHPSRELAPLHPAERGPGPLRILGHHARRLGGVLRVHRLRRGLDRRARDEKPAEGSTDGDPRIARDLHGALHRGVAGPDRHRALRAAVGAPPRGPAARR